MYPSPGNINVSKYPNIVLGHVRGFGMSPHLSASLGGALVAAQRVPAEPVQIGINFIPNMNTGMLIKAPFENDAKLHAAFAAQGLDSNVLPTSFSWNDQDSVRKSGRMKNYNVGWLMQPPNQSTCGSCWAVSSTSCLTDRFSIALQTKIPILSALVTASCAGEQLNHDGCQGGYPSDAGCFFEQIGTTEDSCFPYKSFCPPPPDPDNKNAVPNPSPDCSTTTGQYTCCPTARMGLPSSAPTPTRDDGDPVGCSSFADRAGAGCPAGHPGNVKTCLAPGGNGNIKRYFAAKNSTVSLASGSLSEIQHRMKQAIYLHGPIVAAFNVYGDFILPTSLSNPQDSSGGGWGWKETGGIYIHTTGNSDYLNDQFIQTAWNNRNVTKDTNSAAYKIKTALTSAGADYSEGFEQFKTSLQNYFNIIAGAHAVVVVGWGSGNAGKYGNVNYWIVRNSWGTLWNEKGYFRIAFQDPSQNINLDASMEVWQAGGGPQGGCTAFMPDLSSPHLLNLKTLKSGTGSTGDFKKYAPFIIVFVLIGIFILILYLRKKHQEMFITPQ